MSAQMTEKDQLRFFAKVGLPDENGCMPWLATTDHGGYGQFWLRGRTVAAHRAMHELMLGCIPDGHDIDHLCGTRACVAPAHLRTATRKQNLENLGGARQHSKSGVRGVWPDRGRWRVQIGHNGRNVHIGYFDRIEDAAAAAQAARDELFTHADRDRVAS